MSSLIDNTLVLKVRPPGAIGTRRSLLRPAWVAGMCAVLLTSYALAAPPARASAKKSDCSGGSTGGKQGGQADCESKGGTDLIVVADMAGVSLDDEIQIPGPKWFCWEPTVTVDPIWQGKPLAYTFEICNLGDTDMHIRAKGG